MSDDELAKLEQDLTRNALAFLQRSFRQTIDANDDIQQLSFAVVDLAVSIEVLLKARLAREHWTLVLDHPDNGAPDRSALIAGTAKTVTPGQAVDRLVRLVNVPLGNLKGDKRSRAYQIHKVTSLRNRAAHFTLASMEPLSVRARLGAGLQFVLWFLETEFAESPAKADVDALIDDIGTELGSIEELVKQRLRELRPQLDTADACVTCPRCSQPTLMLQGSHVSEPACPFCRSITSNDIGPNLADEYVTTVLDLSSHAVVTGGGEWPVYDCPECYAEALVAGIEQVHPLPVEAEADNGGEVAYWGCFSCGLARPSTELDFCGHCGRLIEADHGLCADCMHALITGD